MAREQLVFLQEDDTQLLAEAYERVFRPGFDDTELADISGVHPAPGRTVLIARDESGIVAGGVSDTFPECDVALLSYLATRPDRRSRGSGARVLAGLRQRWRDDEHALVVGEVRDPRAWETTDRERPVDRLRFYARHGCHLVPVPWVQPAIGDGGREQGLLLISVYGPALGDVVDSSALAGWAAKYYRDSETVEPNDAQYRALMRRLSAEDLAVIPIEDYERVEPLDSGTGPPSSGS